MRLYGRLSRRRASVLEFADDLEAQPRSGRRRIREHQADDRQAHRSAEHRRADRGALRPVWQPERAGRARTSRTRRPLRSCGVPDFAPTTAGSRCPCSTAAATRATSAGSAPSTGSTSWACRGSTPGARAGSPASPPTRATWPNRIEVRLGKAPSTSTTALNELARSGAPSRRRLIRRDDLGGQMRSSFGNSASRYALPSLWMRSWLGPCRRRALAVTLVERVDDVHAVDDLAERREVRGVELRVVA